MSYRCSLPSPLQKGSKDWEVLIRLLAFPHDPTNLEATQPISLSLGSVPTPQTFDFNQPPSQPPIGFSDLPWPPQTSHDLPWSPMSFSTSVLFFLLKISLLEMLIAVGNEHLKIWHLISSFTTGRLQGESTWRAYSRWGRERCPGNPCFLISSSKMLFFVNLNDYHLYDCIISGCVHCWCGPTQACGHL